MHPIVWNAERHVPIAWDVLPDVDDARPKACPSCRRPAKRGHKVDLHGHGPRSREVVVAPAITRARCHVVACWSRRYRCTRCGKTCTVLPIGVIPRHLYSVFAIVVAFVLTATGPLGDDLTDALAYKRQGLYPRRAVKPGVDWRWVSIDRWRGSIAVWWPFAVDIPDLLAHLHRRAGTDDLQGRLEAAAASHVRQGTPM
ncbi:MAG: hypothetical protein P3B98_11390 [Gemmatimonadota bacterium]|nr:hypothetical protein [Gemmatimonadota bacterium]